jgi:hypothetical protein
VQPHWCISLGKSRQDTWPMANDARINKVGQHATIR